MKGSGDHFFCICFCICHELTKAHIFDENPIKSVEYVIKNVLSIL